MMPLFGRNFLAAVRADMSFPGSYCEVFGGNPITVVHEIDVPPNSEMIIPVKKCHNWGGAGSVLRASHHFRGNGRSMCKSAGTDLVGQSNEPPGKGHTHTPRGCPGVCVRGCNPTGR